MEVSIWSIFENTNVPFSLLMGGVVGTALAVILYGLQMNQNETATPPLMGPAFLSGIKAMMPAILILILAWGLTDIINN